MPQTAVSRRAALALSVMALLGAAGCGRSQSTGTADGAQGFAAGAPVTEVFAAAGRVAPQPIAGELLDGTTFDLASLAGSVIVVNFWASWCAPCRVETKHLVAIAAATEELGVRFVGVNIRDERDKAKAFAEDFGMLYPSLFDPPGKVSLAFTQVPPNVIPATVILDRAGKVAAVFRKAVTQEELEPVVRQVAAEPLS